MKVIVMNQRGSGIQDKRDLCRKLRIQYRLLTYILYKKGIDSFYEQFKISKKSGGIRIISAPKRPLKFVQKRLAQMLQTFYDGSTTKKNNIAHGFLKSRSIITNARNHRNKRYVINIDLENFFDSFHFGRVCGFFEKNKNFLFPKEVAVTLAQLTCYEGSLPQGAPCSPIITNLICQILDYRVLRIAKKFKLNYTRYADDLTFSTNDRKFVNEYDEFIKQVEAEIIRAGFRMNTKKTRFMYKDSRQVVTGLVVNKKLNIPHEYIRRTRAMAHSLYTKGGFNIDGVLGSIEQLEGRLSFINYIDKYASTYAEYKRYNRFTPKGMSGRERLFQQFLFYKYFYHNELPVIITEGKTDKRYIKAALKSLCHHYPALVTAVGNGRFKFHISFLRRSKRLERFLGIQHDGADSMKVISNYYGSPNSEGFPDYYSYFSKYSCEATNPVFLLYDNEISNKNKPIRKMLNFWKQKVKNIVNIVEKQQYCCLQGNLYILTFPTLNGMAENEIEDLILKDNPLIQIGGRNFSRKEDYDISKFFGKNEFSQYVLDNYDKLRFDSFRPLLDTLNSIIKEYKE